MADIKLRIEVNPNAESELLGAITNNNAMVSNTSIKVDSINQFINPPTSEFNGSNGLLWGEEDFLVFNDNDELDNVENSGGYLESEENPNEFFWGIVPQNKQYSVKLTFTGASNLKDIVVFGDKVNNQFPTEAIVDGEKTIYSDDYYWAIDLGTEKDSHTIEFTKWNRANYNACLTLIRVMLKYWEVDKFNGLKSVESLSQNTGQPREIFCGAVPNQGNAEIIDVNGEIADMIKDGVIPNSNVNVEVWANGKKVQNHITRDNEYGLDKVFTLQLGNKLEHWNNILITKRELTSQISAYELLKDVFRITNQLDDDFDEMLTENIVSAVGSGEYSIKDYLSEILIPYPYFENISLMDAVNKICEISLLNVIERDDGKVKFISARPIEVANKEVIVLENKNILNVKDKDIIVKNSHNGITTTKYNYKYDYLNKDSINVQFLILPVPKVYKSNGEDISLYEYNKNTFLSDFQYSPTESEKLIIIKNNLISENDTDKRSVLYEYKYTETNYKMDFKNGDFSDQLLYVNYEYSMSHDIGLSSDGKMLISSFDDANNYSKSRFLTRAEFDSAFYSNGGNSYIKNTIYSGSGVGSYSVVNEDNTLSFYLILPAYVLSDKLRTGMRAVGKYNLNISVKTLSYNTEDTEFGENRVKLNDNNLFQTNEILTNVYNKIKKDYRDGVEVAEITINCLDLYNSSGDKTKDWRKGDIVEVGDVVELPHINDKSWFNKDGSSKKWKITGRRFLKTGAPLIDLQMQNTNLNTNSLETLSWKEIIDISDNGLAKEYFNIGDEKILELNDGTKLKVVIIGFEHDDLSDDSGKAKITFALKDLYIEQAQMGVNGNNNVGWEFSSIRNNLLPSIIEKFPKELKDNIKLVKKQTMNAQTNTLYYINDKCFLLSVDEICNNFDRNASIKEGITYEYWKNFKNGDIKINRIKHLGNENEDWWTRSLLFDSEYYYVFSKTGDVLISLSHLNQGINFAFCI